MSQYRIISGLAAPHRNLCVVGDDDQAIYGWRGAEVRHILNFKRDWPEAKTVRLEENYRSTQQILTWANRLIDFNAYRHAKSLRSTVQGEPSRILQCKDGEVEAQRVVASKLGVGNLLRGIEAADGVGASFGDDQRGLALLLGRFRRGSALEGGRIRDGRLSAVN